MVESDGKLIIDYMCLVEHVWTMCFDSSPLPHGKQGALISFIAQAFSKIYEMTVMNAKRGTHGYFMCCTKKDA